MDRLIQEGPRNAKIVIVGEAPGVQEESQGRPFVGSSGHLLDHMLERARIRRSECFLTNVCHIRPEKNDFDWFLRKENIAHLASGIIQLKSDLSAIRPNLVIALGARPLYILTRKQGIDKWRGSILESTLVPGLKVIATYHPAYILRVWDAKVVSEFDLRRCAEEAKTPDISLPTYDFYLDPPSDVRAAIASEMARAEWLAIDIECCGTIRDIVCVGFADRANRALVVPFNTPADRALVRELCGCPAKKVMQNGMFDITVLRYHGIEVNNFSWDTMLGHHAIYPECATGGDELSGRKHSGGLAKGLAFQTSIYTRQPYYKDDGKLWQDTADWNMLWRYNAMDAAVTWEIRRIQERELREFGTMGVLEHSMSLIEPLLQATATGIRVDKDVREKIRSGLVSQIEALQELLNTAAGRPVNVKSSKDMSWLLFEKLGLKPLKRSEKTGKPSSDKDVLNTLARKYRQPLIHTVLLIREKRDLVERYINAAVSDDGRMRCSFDIAGTRTGRLSSRASLDGSGTNLQTIPEPMRRMFVADPGCVFIYADYSQAEARVVAYLSRCEGLITLFNDPSRDVHTENAARIFKVPIAAVSPEQRYLAKRAVHAANYGMGAKRLAEIVNEEVATTGVQLTVQSAQDLLDRYFSLYPEIREVFWADVERELRRSRTLTTPFGRKRVFYGRWDDKLLREAYSYIPQSTVGDLCCRALVRCHREIPEAVVLLNVHDAILLQCKTNARDKVVEEVKRCMEIPIPFDGHELVIPTEVKVGLNWLSASEDNPDGLSSVA